MATMTEIDALIRELSPDDLQMLRATIDALLSKKPPTPTEHTADGLILHTAAPVTLYDRTKVAIEFAQSTSTQMGIALSIAKAADNFQTYSQSGKQWYRAEWSADKMELATDLAIALRGLRGRRVFIDDNEVDWEIVFGFAYCAAKRRLEYKPATYCFKSGNTPAGKNLWGCRLINMDIDEYYQWWSYGHFEKRAGEDSEPTWIWVFDKRKITEALKEGLFKVRFCPHIRPKFIQAMIDTIPDQVEVVPDGDWKYRTVAAGTQGAITYIPTRFSSELRAQTKSYFLEMEELLKQSALGVVPNGRGPLIKLYREALHKAGVVDVSADDIV